MAIDSDCDCYSMIGELFLQKRLVSGNSKGIGVESRGFHVLTLREYQRDCGMELKTPNRRRFRLPTSGLDEFVSERTSRRCESALTCSANLGKAQTLSAHGLLLSSSPLSVASSRCQFTSGGLNDGGVCSFCRV